MKQKITNLQKRLDNFAIDSGSYQIVCGDFNLNPISTSKNGLKLVA